jgi:uncharacterized HAD superfamily protein
MHREVLISIGLSLALCIGFVEAVGSAFQEYSLTGAMTLDVDANKARNIRTNALYHFYRANKHMEAMIAAEVKNDVDEYEKNLVQMRKEDAKWLELEKQYLSMRNVLQLNIIEGTIKIDGFKFLNKKGYFESIAAHALGKDK